MAYKPRRSRTRSTPRYSARRSVARKPASRSRRTSGAGRRASSTQTVRIVLMTGGEQSVSPFNRTVEAPSPTRSKF